MMPFMRWPGILPLFGVTLLFTSCVPAVGAAPQGRAAVALGEPFTLAPGNTAQVGAERVRITFDAVIADSRCPTDVQCIRAGEAVVRVTVVAQGQTAETVEVRTTPSLNQTSVAGHTLTLTRVLPAPDTRVRHEPANYRATFQLSKP
jgi:hypothetical protein